MPFSFIILTFNSATFVDDLLDSINNILGNQIRKGMIEVVLFDNASTDDTVEKARKYDWVKVTESKENLGFAKGINKAFAHTRGEHIVIINPDATLLEFDGEAIQNEFQDDSLAVAGFPITDFKGGLELNAGKFFNPFTFLLYAIGLESLAGTRFSVTKKMKVDYVSGGFVVFRRKIFEKLKGFDEDYFMYVEDMDICYRAKKEGFHVLALPSATIKHKGQGSSNREFAIVNIYKGLVTFYKKNYSASQLLYIRSLLRIKAALIIFVSSIIGKKDIVRTYTKALHQAL